MEIRRWVPVNKKPPGSPKEERLVLKDFQNVAFTGYRTCFTFFSLFPPYRPHLQKAPPEDGAENQPEDMRKTLFSQQLLTTLA
jgi:hypothetical protein